MIDCINAWLFVWADWSRQSDGHRLGYSSTSSEYKMMTTNRAEMSFSKYRGKRHLISIGKRFVGRDIDPVRCVEKSGKRQPDIIPDHPMAEMMEEAIGALKDPRHKDSIRLKYLCGFDDITSASMMKIGKTSFKVMVSSAHTALDAWIDGRYGDKARRFMLEIDNRG